MKITRITLGTIFSIVCSAVLMVVNILFINYFNNNFPLIETYEKCIIYTFGIGILAFLVFINCYISYRLIKLDLKYG